jgi:hypothetical protein
MEEKKPKFDFKELPTAFFCDNPKANNLRNQLIKNQVRISSDAQADLEEVFFSDENIDLINKQLILAVFNKTKGMYKIPPQTTESLIIVMRYIFIEYARHLPYDVKGQIRDLNCMVVSDVLPNVITNVTQRIDYLKEIQNTRQNNTIPKNVNTNTKNLQSISSILFGK